MNGAQVDYWNGEGGEHWATFAARYDEVLEGFGTALAAAADPRAGDRVVDVGCGSGSTTLAVADRVQSNGSVLGLDLSTHLVTLARRRAETAGAANVRFEVADAAQFDLEAGSVDAMVSRFGVMFFADPPVAFAHLRSALRPAGRLTFVCWQSPLANEWITVPGSAIVTHVELPPTDPSGPGMFSMSDPDEIMSTLEGAGFDRIQIESLVVPQRFGDSLDEAVAFMTETQVAARLLSGLDPARRGRVLEALHVGLAPHATPDGVFLDGAAWLVHARTPR